MTKTTHKSAKWMTLAGVMVAAASMAMPNSATAETGNGVNSGDANPNANKLTTVDTIGQAFTYQIAPPQSDCPSDLDGNGTVDSNDLAIMLASYGKCRNCDADLSGDDSVSQEDIDMLMDDWGPCEQNELGTHDALGFDPRSPNATNDGYEIEDESGEEDSGDADTCVGDLDGDGEVGPADLAIILAMMNSPCNGCDEDIFSDGYVDTLDVLILLSAWGPCNEDTFGTAGKSVGRSIALASYSYSIHTDSEEASCSGDLDGDGEVGPADLAIVLAGLGGTCKNCLADVNGDNEVGTLDLVIVLSQWGSCEF